MSDTEPISGEEQEEGRRRTGWVMVVIVAVVAFGYAAVLFIGGQALQDAPGAGPILKLKQGLENITNAQPPRGLGALPPLTGGKSSTPLPTPSAIFPRRLVPSPTLSPKVVPPASDAPSVVTFTIEYTNDTGVQLTQVKISDKIPSGTTYRTGSATQPFDFDGNQLVFNIGTLAPGQSGKVSFQAFTRLKGKISNKATLTSAEAPASTIDTTATV